MRVLFVDTETPGFTKPLQPIEAAGCYSDSVFVDSAVTGHFMERFKPTVPIEYGAVSVHHILPGELDDKPRFDSKKFQAERLVGVSFVVGHNVDFDLEVLGVKGIKAICTLALARYWVPDLDSHKLGALTYHEFGMTDDTRNSLKEAHSALSDIVNTVNWLHAAVRHYAPISGPNPVHNWQELYALSEVGRVPYRMTFGKYGPKDGKQGKRIRDLKIEDAGYVSWLRKNCSEDKYLMKALDNPR